MKNKIEDVRNLLIEGMEKLVNPEKNQTFGAKEAKELAHLGAVVIDSAKAEIDFIRATGAVKGSGFIQVEERKRIGG